MIGDGTKSVMIGLYICIRLSKVAFEGGGTKLVTALKDWNG
jgi:hypothetical protein